MNYKTTGFSQIIVLFLLILVGAGAYFLGSQNISQTFQGTPSPTSTPDPTTNWKTYTNDEFNYVIKYPADFKLFFDENTPVIMKPGVEMEGTDAFAFYKIAIERFQTNKTLDQVVDEYKDKGKDFNGPDTYVSETFGINLSDRNGKFFYVECQGYCQDIFIEKGNNIFLRFTVIYSSKETQSQYQNEVDQILSTFKFVY